MLLNLVEILNWQAAVRYPPTSQWKNGAGYRQTDN